MVNSKAEDDNNSGNNDDNGVPVIPWWEEADPEDQYLGPQGVSRQLNKGVQSMRWAIEKSRENYEKTGN